MEGMIEKVRENGMYHNAVLTGQAPLLTAGRRRRDGWQSKYWQGGVSA